MEQSKQAVGRPLDFLKIWHTVFSKNLQYAVECDYIAPDNTPESVGDERNCPLGKWLSSQSDELRSLTNFSNLISVHRSFHALSAEIARLQLSQQGGQAKALLDPLLLNASENVCLAIDALNEDMVEHGLCSERRGIPIKKSKSIWDPSYAIGVPKVDLQHHAIATLIDEVLVNGDISCASQEGGRFLSVLTKMIRNDVKAEDLHLANLQSQNVDCSTHRLDHECILEYLGHLESAIAKQEILTFIDVGRFLANWYIDHLVTHDFELGEGHSH